MELIRNLHNLRERHRDCVATIGNFDGIHLGHLAIIRQLKKSAQSHGLPSSVLIFEPQPQEFFSPHDAPARIMRLREKLEKLDQMGIDRVVCLRFNNNLSSLPAEAFIEEILIDGLGVKELIIGHDFKFGKGRDGDFSTLVKYGKVKGYSVISTEDCEYQGKRISSTWLREVLGNGNMELASLLLDHPFSISGRIVHGDKRGRELGFPTININLHRMRSPVKGIFVSRVHGLSNKPLSAVSSIGTRPMFDGTRINLEAYILDFRQDVYGKKASVELLQKIRDEIKFDNLNELKKEIEEDIKITKKYFNQ